MKRGYDIVVPDLRSSDGLLDDDAQVRCLSWLIRRIPEIYSGTIPPGVEFEVIPIQYLGGPYPGIGLYEDVVAVEENLMRLSLDIEKQLDAFIKQKGLSQIAELSAGEKIRWQDVLRQHEMV